MDTRQVERVAEHADVLQVGSRNMQNFSLLAELGRIRRPAPQAWPLDERQQSGAPSRIATSPRTSSPDRERCRGYLRARIG
jgi:hypothetical protein